MSGISTNRTNITVPTEVAQEILQKTQQGSAVMRLARQVKLPGNGLTIPVITSDPQAAWVAETGAKTVSNPGLTSKIMQAYKLAVIVPFSDEFRRDLNSLYEALVSRLPLALAEKFDNTVIGAVEKPGENFDNFALCTAQSLIKTESHSVWGALTGAYTDIADHKGILNGFAISPSAKGILLADVDSTGRPIFVDGVGSDGVARVLGAPTIESRGMYKAGAAPVGSAKFPGIPVSLERKTSVFLSRETGMPGNFVGAPSRATPPSPSPSGPRRTRRTRRPPSTSPPRPPTATSR